MSRKEAEEIAAMQRNAVTVPEDKLAELQRKAKLVDELVEVLEAALSDDQPYIERAKKAIAKAKGELCSTLCHPEEPCSITESGKCEAKGE